MERLGFTHRLTHGRPRGEEVAVMELPRGPLDGWPRPWVTSASETAVERVGEGRYTAMVHGEWEIWGP